MFNRDFAAGVIVFHTQCTGAPTYLVIKSAADFWEFPKGTAEPGETWRQTALRELAEETGITDLTLTPGFSRQIQYVYRHKRRGIILKTDRFLLGHTPSSTVRLSREHTDFIFAPFERAVTLLTYPTTRALLRDADAFLRPNLSSPAGSS